MNKIIAFKKQKPPRVRKRIKEILSEAEELINTRGCDSLMLIMSKGNAVEMFSFGKGVLHRAGMCDYAKHICMESMKEGD